MNLFSHKPSWTSSCGSVVVVVIMCRRGAGGERRRRYCGPRSSPFFFVSMGRYEYRSKGCLPASAVGPGPRHRPAERHGGGREGAPHAVRWTPRGGSCGKEVRRGAFDPGVDEGTVGGGASSAHEEFAARIRARGGGRRAPSSSWDFSSWPTQARTPRGGFQRVTAGLGGSGSSSPPPTSMRGPEKPGGELEFAQHNNANKGRKCQHPEPVHRDLRRLSGTGDDDDGTSADRRSRLGAAGGAPRETACWQ